MHVRIDVAEKRRQDGDLSILYLRCVSEAALYTRRGVRAFNSLFEMPHQGERQPLRYNILSILYLRCTGSAHRDSNLSAQHFQFSI